jgi:hypothetical protein
MTRKHFFHHNLVENRLSRESLARHGGYTAPQALWKQVLAQKLVTSLGRDRLEVAFGVEEMFGAFVLNRKDTTDRVRRGGAGCADIEMTQTEVKAALDQLVDPLTRPDQKHS